MLGKPQKRVIDHERDVWLQFLLRQRSNTRVLKLVWKGNVIPFEAIRTEVRDEPPGEIWYCWRLGVFGGTNAAKLWDGTEPYEFCSSQLRRQAQMLAVEALLAYGDHYDGDVRPDEYNRVEFEGRLYRKSDFGLE